METKLETLNSYTKKLKVEITPEELIPVEQKVIKQYQNRAELPGFRKGRAPINIVKKRYADQIQHDLVDDALRQYYMEALKAADIEPVSQGKITDFQYEGFQSAMKFEIEVEVEPEFELKKYKGLKVEKDIYEVNDEMVEDALGRLREQYATVREVEEAKEGHFLYFEAQELDEGNHPIIGHKYENLQVELGSGKFDAEMEHQLIGIKKDEKRIVRTEAGNEAEGEDQQSVNNLEIHVKRIEEKDFPELNDEFVKNLDDDSLENMAQLTERMRENLKNDLAYRAEQTFTNRIIDELLKENPFDVPPSMIENYLDEMIQEIKNQSPERKVEENVFRKEYRVSAIHNLRWHFLKKKLQKAENISVTNEEAIEFIDKSQLDDKLKTDARKNQHYIDHLKTDLLEQKIISFLKENSEVIEVNPMARTNITDQ